MRGAPILLLDRDEGMKCGLTISRRTLLHGAAGTLAAAGVGPGAVRRARGQPARRPNILFIMGDDLGWADLGCYGQYAYATPALDELADGGVRLTHAYSASAVCSPTRLAVITGRYQYRLPGGLTEPMGGRQNTDPRFSIPTDHPTLPGLLRQAGYATALVGKWHLSAAPGAGPLERGYEHFFGIRAGAVDYFTHKDIFGVEQLVDGDRKVDRDGYLTDLLTERAIKLIEGRDPARPFFLSLHYTTPHWPWEGPDDAAEATDIRWLPSYDRGSLETYAEMVKSLDTSVGRVLAALDRAGIAEDTIVVLTSDNGGERYAYLWPYTGQKGDLLEGGIRIPTLIRWPARLQPRVSEQMAISMDWLPTLLAAAGVAPDPAYPSDGIDLLPHLEAGTTRPRTLFWRMAGNDQAAVRDGPWKYLKVRRNEFLFDIVADPRERANLAGRHPDVFLRLQQAHAAWNETMLPEPPDYGGYVISPAQIADNF